MQQPLMQTILLAGDITCDQCTEACRSPPVKGRTHFLTPRNFSYRQSSSQGSHPSPPNVNLLAVGTLALPMVKSTMKQFKRGKL